MAGSRGKIEKRLCARGAGGSDAALRRSELGYEHPGGGGGFPLHARASGRKKLILKGNHDYWWSTAAKAYKFFSEQGFDSLQILHNNCYAYGDYALCGTRGWFYEEETGLEHDAKIMRREILRLEASLNAAGEREKLVFLHYPPIYQKYECPEILELLEKHKVRLCCYGHIHGKGISAAFNGWRGCTEFRLVSADAVDFAPVKLLD